MIVYYEVYAERTPEYGRTNYGCFKKETNAKKRMEKLKKKCVDKGEEYNDGYYETDWDIEIHNIFLEDD